MATTYGKKKQIRLASATPQEIREILDAVDLYLSGKGEDPFTSGGSPIGLNRAGIMPRLDNVPLASERPCEICGRLTVYRRTRCCGCGRLMGLRCCYGRLGSGQEGPHCKECP